MIPDPSPDDPDPFAEHLRTQPPRELPEHWRAEILAAASRTATPVIPPSRWHRAIRTLGAWLWPHPAAYAGLAAVWALIMAMRLSTPAFETGPVFARSDSSFAGLAAPGNGVPIFESVRLANQESSLLYATEGQP